MIALSAGIEHFMKHQPAENVLDVDVKSFGRQGKVGVNNVEIAEDGWCSKIKAS